MKTAWRRMAALVLAMILALSMTPALGEEMPDVEQAIAEMMSEEALGADAGEEVVQARAETYGKTTSPNVNVRKSSSTDSDYWFRVPEGYVCSVLATTVRNNITWYKVDVADPESQTGRRITGYIHGDFFRLLTTEETVAWLLNPVQPGAHPQATTSSGESDVPMGEIIRDEVNFRSGPSLTSGSHFKLARGTVIELLALPGIYDADPWYYCKYDGIKGYVQGPFIKVLNSGNLIPGGGTATAAPTVTGMETASPYTPVPAATATPAVTQGYIRTTIGKVNHRLTPGGTVIQLIEKSNIYFAYTKKEKAGGYTWYYVEYNGSWGYLRSDCVKEVGEESVPTPTATAVPTATPTPDPDVTAAPTATAAPVVTATPTATPGFGYVKTIATGVNLRVKPAGASQEQIAINVVLPLTGAPVVNGIYTWYPVRAASGRTGYLRGDCVVPCNADGSTTVATPTPVPTVTATPAPTSVPVLSYIRTTVGGVNFRKTPGGTTLDQIARNVTLLVTGQTVKQGGYTWYPANYGSQAGYLRGDCVRVLTEAEVQEYLASVTPTPTVVPTTDPSVTPGPTATPAPIQHLITIKDRVNLRVSATKDSSSKFQVAIGTVIEMKGSTIAGGGTWYKVSYQGFDLWVLDECVHVMTQAEYEAYQQSTATPTPTVFAPVGYVKTTAGGLNVRSKANGTTILGRISEKGTVLEYYGTEMVKGKRWYYVLTPYGMGYISGDYTKECTPSGGTPTPAPAPTPTPGRPQEATYTTLKLGSTGDAVLRLVTELKNQGFYFGVITDVYTTEVETAVKSFQRAKGLTADGIAGSETQHKLFGTVPPGWEAPGMVIYPAEKIDWYTGGIQDMIPRGFNFQIYDVYTGNVWWAHRWAGGDHADIEPLTAADTAVMCKMYGVSTASQIASQDLWQRRPCLVTVNNHTYACSLYGEPHGTQTITNNNFPGQCCLHFTNSKTHGSNKVDSYHAAAIQYAIDHAPNGSK